MNWLNFQVFICANGQPQQTDEPAHRVAAPAIEPGRVYSMTVDLDRPRRHIKTLRRWVPAGRRDGDDLKILAMANSLSVAGTVKLFAA